MTLVVHHRDDLQRVAHRALRDRGLLETFDSFALEQLDGIRVASEENGADIRDLRGLPWCSIDNDESRDLDQLSAALDLGDGSVRVFVAIADVDTLVDKDTPIDAHAAHNTAWKGVSTRVATIVAVEPTGRFKNRIGPALWMSPTRW